MIKPLLQKSLLSLLFFALTLFVTEAFPSQNVAAQTCILAPQISRVSLANGGGIVNGRSNWASISGDGRFVEFESLASNLIANDGNFARDVFVYDRQSALTNRASVPSTDGDANAHSFASDLSSDGRYVAFESWASNLVIGDKDGIWDVFVRDIQTGATSRVSLDSNGLQGNRSSTSPQISGDGRFVAFDSLASNLVAGDTNGESDVFLYDLQTSQITSLSAGGNHASMHPAISADGRYIAFISFANNLAAGDSDTLADLLVYDRQGATMTRVVMASTNAGDDRSAVYPALSDDGRFLTFESEANGLVAGDSNGLTDIFVFDQQSGQTSLASSASNGASANGSSTHPRLSADGHLLVFQSQASNLVASDANGVSDIFIRDLQSGHTNRITIDPNCSEANGASYAPDVSADGHYVAFTSEATNLIPGDNTLCQGNNCADVFVAATSFIPVSDDLPQTAPTRNFFAGDVHLTWRGVTWARQYHVQVSQDSTFTSTPDADEMVAMNTFELDLSALPAGTYYWRVQAQKIDNSWSLWSAVETFTVTP